MKNHFFRNTRKNQRGLTLLELLTVIVIVGIFATVGSQALPPIMGLAKRIETNTMLRLTGESFRSAYAQNLVAIIGDSAAQLVLPNGTVAPAVANSSNYCTASITTFAPMTGYMALAGVNNFRDGYRQPVCLFVTPLLTASITGSTVPYKNIAIVSMGPNGILDTSGTCTTGLSAAGVLTTCGDDVGYLIDGRPLSAVAIEVTEARLNKLVNLYQSFYMSRLDGDPSRDPSVNYFAAPTGTQARWDLGNPIGQTLVAGTCQSVPLTTVTASGDPIFTVLGLAAADAKDGFGGVIELDNCSDAVNSPLNSSATRQAPPYTSKFISNPPGMSAIERTATGAL
jgi:prepilin-type N-terminal cleavage/methylation domain-containing protein